MRSLSDSSSDWRRNTIRSQTRAMETDPMQGVDLGNGMRKVRMAIASKGKGKSSGARVITYHVVLTHEHIEVNLLTIYDKSELANVSDSYLKSFLTELL